jgi:hypothetical protein
MLFGKPLVNILDIRQELIDRPLGKVGRIVVNRFVDAGADRCHRASDPEKLTTHKTHSAWLRRLMHGSSATTFRTLSLLGSFGRYRWGAALS